ncbi:MAG: protease HtpX [Bacteriovoracia bacterium]
MAWLKRIGLFIAVNLLVMVTISVILNVLGVGNYITRYGLDYSSLMVFCLVWGMGGAFISLALSRVMAKWMMGVRIIPADTRDPTLSELVETVHELARAARLPAMPQVGIYDSPEVNAFATGPSKSRSLVAVSTGLLQRMRKGEVHGVLGHEVAHIANGDMVTMTLIQGIVNAFVMFLARVIAFALTMSGRDRDSEESSVGSPMAYYAVQFVLEIVFMILGSIVVAWFSRLREYRADAGGARLAGRENMVQALQALQRTFEGVDPSAQPAIQALKISSRPGGIMRLFSTHPALSDRIARLQNAV